MRRTFLITALVWLVTLVVSMSDAFAQDLKMVAVRHQSTDAQGSKMLELNGVRGRWFPLDTAGMLLEEHLEVAQLRSLVAASEHMNRVLEDRLSVAADRYAECGRTVELSKTAVKGLSLAVESASLSQRATEDELRNVTKQALSWYRHPILWVSVGIVAGGASVYLVSATTN